MKVRGQVIDRDTIDAARNLTSVTVVLTLDACGPVAGFSGSRFVDAADGVWVSMFGCDDVLAPVWSFLFVPNDRLRETLRSASCDTLIQCDRFGVLSLNTREQTAHIDER